MPTTFGHFHAIQIQMRMLGEAMSWFLYTPYVYVYVSHPL